PDFDFQEIATARRLPGLLAAGMSPQTIEKKLAELARYLPSVQRPLAQLSIIVEGKNLLLRQGDGLIAPGGQLWFDFQPEQVTAEGTAPGADDSPSASDRIEATLPLPPPRVVATTSSISAIVA